VILVHLYVCVQLFGPREAEAIALPPCGKFMNVEVQRTVASEMLSRGLQRGLVIHCVDNNILVYRLCQSVYMYMGRNDVTESTVTIRSPFCGYNLA